MDKPNGNGARGGGRRPVTAGRGKRTQRTAQTPGALGATGDAGRTQSAWPNPNGARAAAGPAPSARANPNGARATAGPAPSAWPSPNGARATAGPAPSALRNPGNGGKGPQQPTTTPSASVVRVTAGPVQSAWGKPNAAQSSAAPAPLSWRNTDNGGARSRETPQAVAIPQQAQGVSRREAPVAGPQGAVGREDNRGAVRGKRVIYDVVHSRPRDLVTKCGNSGAKVNLMANYFRILKKPNWSIHQYRVDFSPDVEMVRLRRAYLGQHKQLFGGYIFDGTVLFCANFFMDQAENGQKELLTKNREGEIIQIKIKHVGIVDATDVQHIQIQNLIVRRAMEGLKLQLVGRNFYDPGAKINMDSYRMEIWPGYQTSIRQHERDILMCAEITHKVMRTENLYQILSAACKAKDYQQAFKKLVVGTVVLTDYNNKTYRIDDVDFSSSPMSKFSTKKGELTYMEYYEGRYHLKIRDAKQPLLVSRPTERNIRGGQNEFIMLIPELSRATGITDEMRNNFRLMKAMGEHTRLNPDRRIDRLRNFNKRLQNSGESTDVLTQWNMRLDTNLVEMPGRILKSETIFFGNQRRVTCDRNADWSREFRSNTMYSHVDITRWSVVVPKRNLREIQDFVKMCIRAASSMRMRIFEPSYEEMPDDRNTTYSQTIETAAAKDPQILLLVMANNNEEKYSCIKKKCCVDRPIPSQVVTLRTVAPKGDKTAGLMSIATKIVIQMNAKLMGTPWMIDLPLSGLMTVGFDVCHSAKDKNKSFGALVATMDIRKSSRYFSAVTPHLKGQELSNEIGVKMSCALKQYQETHGSLPERILFFRDGVGDGQLHQVFNTEVQFLKQKLDSAYKTAGIATGCRLAFIIVSKRINTRYFSQLQNPVPGTVVDDVITLPERYDFFLVSQSVRQGTVSPTSYNVIHDNMGLSADKLQILTYKMTHLYYNWSGTLRVPAVCQYAHKLAFLVAESIHSSPHNALQNQLYFL